MGRRFKSRSGVWVGLMVLGFACALASELSSTWNEEANMDPALAYERAREQLLALETEFLSLQTMLSGRAVLQYDLPSICQGRLTTVTATPVTTADETSKSTIYFTPYQGSTISLYDGTTYWQLYNFSEFSLALSALTSGDNYDVFVYSNSGTPALELSAAWTSNTARSDAITTQGGVWVKSADKTRRYVGTIRTTATTTTEDSAANRFVWNNCNRRPRYMWANEATTSWNYSNSTWRSVDADATVRLQFVVGIAGTLLSARVAQGNSGSSVTNNSANGMGLDSTTSNSAQLYGNFPNSPAGGLLISEYQGYPAIGYHYLQWMEASSETGGTFSYYSTNSNAIMNSGFYGEIDG